MILDGKQTVMHDQFTPRQMCTQLKDIASKEDIHLVCRPQNRFEPDKSAWWLLRSTEWPAYSSPKLYCELENGKLKISLHIEKGISSDVAEALGCAKAGKLVMDDTWSWHTLLRGGEQPSLVIVPNTETEMVVQLTYVDNPCDFEPTATQPGHDRYIYQPSEEGFRLVDANTPAGIVRRTKLNVDLSSPGSFLRALTDCKWLWVDFFLGIHLNNILAEEAWEMFARPMMKVWSPS